MGRSFGVLALLRAFTPDAVIFVISDEPVCLTMCVRICHSIGNVGWTYTRRVTETAPPSDDPLDRRLADAERNALLDLPLPAVFSTVAADGSVHSVPIHFVFIDNEIRFIAESGSVKVRNARRTGRATLCVTATVDGERRYVTVEGPVRVEDGLAQADLDALDHSYGRDSGSAADEEYADTVTLVVRPERWLGRADSD